MMLAYLDVLFASRTFPATHSGDTTAELAGELYVVIRRLGVPLMCL